VPAVLLPTVVAGAALLSDDFTLDLAPPALRPSLPSVLLGSAGSDGSGSGLRVTFTELSAHPHSQVVGFAKAEVAPPQAGSPALSAQAMNELLQTQPTGAGPLALQVRGVAVTGGSLHVRFNQAIDLARLATVVDAAGAMRSTQVVVMRGGQAVPGLLLPDPDALGFRFVPDGGPLPAGEYAIHLRSRGDGFVNQRGELLDGDYDGAAGGDYRARFQVEGVSLRGSLPEVPAGAQRAEAAAEAEAEAEALPWGALLGGAGGMSMLMAGMLPAPGATRRPGARPSAPPPRLRQDRDQPAGAQPLQRPQAAWLSGWLNTQPPPGNDWRIRL
jgi:hypothetical protein